MDCRNVRNEIQNYLDGDAPLSRQAKGHLSACTDCRELIDAYGDYAEGLKKAIDTEIQQLGDPDFAFLRRHPKLRDRRLLMWAGAALLAVAVSAPFAYQGFAASRARAYIREDNRRFVESLLSGNILESGNGFLADSPLFEGNSWFQGTEGISGMLEGSPLF